MTARIAGQHRLDARRGEDLAGDRRRQHALADEAGMRRLVAGAAAGDDATFDLSQSARSDDLDLRIAVEPGERRRRRASAAGRRAPR